MDFNPPSGGQGGLTYQSRARGNRFIDFDFLDILHEHRKGTFKMHIFKVL
jgi:hypothetical protein